MTRHRYTVTGYDGSGCGHAHPTREEAAACRRRGRSNVERVAAEWGYPERPARGRGWFGRVLFGLVLAAAALAAWSVWFL